MNNGQINVTNIPVSYDVSPATEIELRNTGEVDVSIGFGDLNSEFVFGDGIMLKVGESIIIDDQDARRGDGTFFAVTKDTVSTSSGKLSYSADGGVSPTLLVVATPLNGADDVEVDAVPSVKFSADIDDGVFNKFALFTDDFELVPGTAELVGDTYTYTPDDDLENNALYILVWGVYDFNGKANSGMSIFTTVVS